jgi:hypothetical protein
VAGAAAADRAAGERLRLIPDQPADSIRVFARARDAGPDGEARALTTFL